MPACAISASVIAVRSIVCPKYTVPASGRVLPVITSIIIVLPAPLGPMMQRSSPSSIVSDSSLSARKPLKLTVMPSRYRIGPCVVSTPAPAMRMPTCAELEGPTSVDGCTCSLTAASAQGDRRRRAGGTA